MAIFKKKKKKEGISKEVSKRIIRIAEKRLKARIKEKKLKKPVKKEIPIKPKSETPVEKKPAKGFDISKIKQIMEKKKGKEEMREVPKKKLRTDREYIKTGIPGFDQLFEKGIPKGVNILVAGGAGSGKTIMCLHILANKCKEGKKVLYMSFEESKERLIEHMEDFGWDAKKFIKEGNLVIQRLSPFEIARAVDAMLAKAKGELVIDVDPVILPKDFNPDFVVVDSLSSIESAFTAREDTYRTYIEQLFRFFEKMRSNAFLITETEQIPTTFSRSGMEEFLADGVIVLYNIRKGDVRENALEVLKLRGAKHKKRTVAMRITSDVGIEVYPEQVVFGLEEGK